jgi:pyrimidine operon attenuation protein/uracil phosphoribosyltransferase
MNSQKNAQVLLDSAGVDAALHRMAATLQAQRQSLSGRAAPARLQQAPWAVLGIRRGGVPLAKRLAGLLQQGDTAAAPPLGSLDINLYRDDGLGPRAFPLVGTTHIPFDPTAHAVVLVDDVLFTGRTVRAALQALADYGRPAALRLAVLVDRQLHELPVAADATGLAFASQHGQHVEVCLQAIGHPEDAVLLHAEACGHVS